MAGAGATAVVAGAIDAAEWERRAQARQREARAQRRKIEQELNDVLRRARELKRKEAVARRRERDLRREEASLRHRYQRQRDIQPSTSWAACNPEFSGNQWRSQWDVEGEAEAWLECTYVGMTQTGFFEESDPFIVRQQFRAWSSMS